MAAARASTNHHALRATLARKALPVSHKDAAQADRRLRDHGGASKTGGVRIETTSDRQVQFHPSPFSFERRSNVVFYGKNLTKECRRCGAFEQTEKGHYYCAQVTCPIALKETKRRKRRRTSTLEQVYLPRVREGVASKPE